MIQLSDKTFTVSELIMKAHLILLYSLMLNSFAAHAAGNADVLNVRTNNTAPETWTFSVTVQHPDTGWKDYANGWDVVLPDGTVVKPVADEAFTRTLWHPHINEQPFTRSQGGVHIPADIKRVTVRAHDIKDGWGGREISIDLH